MEASINHTKSIIGFTYEMIPLDIRKIILDLVLYDRIINRFMFCYLNITMETVIEIRKLCRVLLLSDPREVANAHIEQVRRKCCVILVTNVLQIYDSRIWNRNDKFVLLTDHDKIKIVHRGQLIHTIGVRDPVMVDLLAKIWELLDSGITITPTILSWLKYMTRNTTYFEQLNMRYTVLCLYDRTHISKEDSMTTGSKSYIV